MTADLDRLQRLLGGPDLAGLRMRLRARFERSDLRDAFTLTDLTAVERRALEGLLGRAPKVASSMQLSRTELDRAIARAGLATDLRHALEALDGTIEDRRAQRAQYDESWRSLLDTVEEESPLRGLVEDPSGVALLKRSAAGDHSRAAQLLEQARRVLLRLPAKGVPLAHLAAEVLGDSHALDAGQPVAAIVLRACRLSTRSGGPDAAAMSPAASVACPTLLDDSAAVDVDALGDEIDDTTDSALPDDASDTPNRSTREQWALLGVTVNELAAPVLCLNLPVKPGTPVGDVVLAASHYGEPIQLTLRALLRNPPTWDVAGRDVFVCENPSIVALAADRLGSRCAPLVCTDGMPAAAQRTLLQQLAAAGARLRYHGDFDWPGLRIGNFVVRELRAQPWRFGASDYLAVAATAGPPLLLDERVAAIWDEPLSDAMAACGFAVHEERVFEALLGDLGGYPGSGGGIGSAAE